VLQASDLRELTIGEVARQVGVSVSTLRAWAAAGISRPARDEQGNRRYTLAERDRLREIKRLRDQEDMSLAEIRRRWQSNGAVPDTSKSDDRVAGRLRSLRHRLRLSLRQVGERTGLSASHVSAVEKGYVRPSVASLLKLSQAYGVNILSFYEPSAEPRRRLVPNGAAETIAMGDPGSSVALLTPHGSAIELHLFELAPGAHSGGFYRHEGDEFWYVIRGTLGVWLADDFFRLEASDCLSFASTDEHRFANLGEGVTVFLGGNTPSTF
jgi:DNA-binding transcriptional MerR regulator/mannose-6-phosphate isomerase-like protein (cupin superfamily)